MSFSEDWVCFVLLWRGVKRGQKMLLAKKPLIETKTDKNENERNEGMKETKKIRRNE